MVDLALVAALETRMFNAWPALETRFLDGWVLRFANGYSRRANSASALSPGAALDEATITAIERDFAARDIRVVVRLSPLAAPSVDGFLAARGYTFSDTTLVLAGPIAPDGRPDPETRLDPAPPPGWIAANASSYGGEKSDAGKLTAIVSRIAQPAAFATVMERGEAVAWGIGVVERGWMVLQDLVVRPDRRGNGVGRRLTTSLMAFGAREGAHAVYLQAREDNHVAHALYRKLGMREVYRYSHRER